jgi:hypothetical protein
MVLDADVLLPGHSGLRGADLDPGCWYGARCRMCPEEAGWMDYRNGRRGLESFPVERLPVLCGRIWGTLQTSNEAGLCGYLQFWNPAHAKGWTRFREAPTASNYDVLFGLSFPESARKFLPDYEVLHLGPARVNWAGRMSARWGSASGAGALTPAIFEPSMPAPRVRMPSPGCD